MEDCACAHAISHAEKICVTVIGLTSHSLLFVIFQRFLHVQDCLLEGIKAVCFAVATTGEGMTAESMREFAVDYLDGLQRVASLITRLLYCQRSLGGLSLQDAVQQALLDAAPDKFSDAASNSASDAPSNATSCAAAAECCSSSADVKHSAQNIVEGAHRVLTEQRVHNAQQASAAPASTAEALSVLFPLQEKPSAAAWAKLGPIVDRAIAVVQWLDHIGMRTGPDFVGEHFCKLMTTIIQLLSLVLVGKHSVEAQYWSLKLAC